jgi:hypothetical protein
MVGGNIVASWQGWRVAGTFGVVLVTGATTLIDTREPLAVDHGPRPDGAGTPAVVVVVVDGGCCVAWTTW